MDNLVKQILRRLLEEGQLRKRLGGLIYRAKRNGDVDDKIISNYFKENDVSKLHIGCSGHMLMNWLNSDYRPAARDVLHLDATATFPFEDNQFDYVFSEHMIEHVDFPHGRSMLAECYRVLKVGGKVRISTPDLAFLINLRQNEKSDLQEEYIRWNTDRFIAHAPYYDSVFVINNFVRDWGHSFIYDEMTLRYSLESTGFTEVVRCDLNCSQDSALRGLENDARMPSGFLALETITLEGRKGSTPETSSIMRECNSVRFKATPPQDGK